MMFCVQALQKVSKLEADNQSIGQVSVHTLHQLEQGCPVRRSQRHCIIHPH